MLWRTVNDGWRKAVIRSTAFNATTRRFTTEQPARKCVAYRLGTVEYVTAWDWQKQLIQQRFRSVDRDDVVLVLNHPSVYTLGRGASMANVKFDPKVDNLHLIRVDRGGEVTYHGPGQLVVYPILDLQYLRKDLHWYLRQVEEVVIQTLAKFDITGERVDGQTGVWVADGESAITGEREMKKVAAVGTHASKWITMHGFAINVTTDLRAFDRIIPCGIDDRAVTSMEQLQCQATMTEVEVAAIEAIQEVFGLDVTIVDAKTPF